MFTPTCTTVDSSNGKQCRVSDLISQLCSRCIKQQIFIATSESFPKALEKQGVTWASPGDREKLEFN